MMMGMDKKKLAMIIVKTLGDAHSKGSEGDYPEKKKKSEDDEYNNDMPAEMAMSEFIEAIHSKDAKKATKAYMDFKELCSGMDYQRDMGSHEED